MTPRVLLELCFAILYFPWTGTIIGQTDESRNIERWTPLLANITFYEELCI